MPPLNSNRSCLVIHARLKTARESYTRFKKGISNTDLTTENMAAKVVPPCMPESGQIAARRGENPTRARIRTSTKTSSYLALNWQRRQVNAGVASRDRRFPTPLQ